MPAKNKRKQKSKQIQQIKSQNDSNIGDDEQINPQIHNININTNNSSTIQISSAQAEVYFEYLRKKILHQANDPFSLPFLNLKFQQQQLQSWKGATQHLNLQSRIYGMKVDNCHDYTIKMLNYVIRNQQQEISRPQVKNNSSSITSINPDDYMINQNQSQSQKNFNFHLQKAQKLISNIQIDKNLSNRSLWKAIFKKIETLQKIQLNTLEISDNLSLEIDEKNLKGCKNYQDDQKQRDSQQYLKKDQIDNNFVENVLGSNRLSTDKLKIFQQISDVKNDIFQQIQQILQCQNDRENNRNNDTSIQQPLYQNYFGYQEIDFDGIYQEFNQFIRYQQHAKSNANSQKTNFNFQQEENKQQVFAPIQRRDLYSIPIDHINMMNSQMQQFQYQQQDDDNNAHEQLQGDLYEPHKDILFHSTFKKAKASKKIQAKNHAKRKKNHNTLIDFYDPSIVINRKNIFKQRKQVKNNIQNDNLVPINYVVLYQSRNPFKKLKKVNKQSNRISFYENYQSLPLMDFRYQNGRGKQSLHQINVSQTLDEPFQFYQVSNQINHQQAQICQGQNLNEQRNYRNVSMKTVKNEIIKEMSYIEEHSMGLTNQKTRQSYFSLNSQTSMMESYLQEEGRRIGFKLLKQKMTNYDPLDILMSMLHVAYENQVLLQPVYASQSENKPNNIFELKDIIIHGEL